LSRFSRAAYTAGFASAMAIGAVVATAAAAATPPGSADVLTPRLATLAEPANASGSRAEQAAAVSLPKSGPGALLRDGDLVVVDVRFDRIRNGTAAAIRRAGGQVRLVSHRYSTVVAGVAPQDLAAVASLDGAQSVAEEYAPMVAGAGSGGGSSSRAPCTGAATTEGDVQLRANLARTSYNVSGSGIKVGVLSDSYDRRAAAPHAAEDIASGDLPGAGNPCGHTTAVQVLDDTVVGADEGRAMAQIVHDLAPSARLAFATASSGELDFAQNIRDLATANSDVIVDDVTYFDEPFFQDGPIAVAVDDVVADGVTYVSHAANINIISGGKNVPTWEAPALRPTECLPFAGALGCMDFQPTAAVDSTYGIRVPNGRRLNLVLQWAQPWNGVTTDLDAFLINSADTSIASSTINNLTSQKPFEFISWLNNTGTSQDVRLLIQRNPGRGDTGTPRLKTMIFENGPQDVVPLEYTTSSGGDVVGPSVYGHDGAEDAIGTGAVPFNDSTTVEPYSSRGPIKHYFGPVVGSSPAPPLATVKTIQKPDVVATDGGANTFFGSFTGGVFRFFGTSAAAPHDAGVAALIREGDPAATPAQVKTAIKSTARNLVAFPVQADGSGLVDAKAAVAARLPAVTIADRSIVERDSGARNMVFTVRLSKASAAVTDLRYTTSGGTATATDDYVKATNVLKTIPAGATTATIPISIKGDTAVEPNETFNLRLTRPTRLNLTDTTAVGTITNDD
jgi:hypothetical protein